MTEPFEPAPADPVPTPESETPTPAPAPAPAPAAEDPQAGRPEWNEGQSLEDWIEALRYWQTRLTRTGQ